MWVKKAKFTLFSVNNNYTYGKQWAAVRMWRLPMIAPPQKPLAPWEA